MKNKVELELSEYNKLRDSYNAFRENKVCFNSCYSDDMYYTESEVIKKLTADIDRLIGESILYSTKLVEQKNLYRISCMHNDINVNKLEIIKGKSLFGIIKWWFNEK